MEILGYIAFDQYGNNYHIKKHPRKELLEQLDRQHAEKMYVDTIDGKVRHIGYVIGGLWLRVNPICSWKEAE